MCGIAGAFGIDGARARVEAMLDVMGHRGPDGSGIEEVSDGVIGHVRLAVLDPTPAGAQPMSSASGRFVISYNGEVYNYREMAAALSIGAASGTDTEVLLEAWACDGRDVLPSTIGMFAFMVWDREERALTAVRDRFGVKPLYFAALEGGLLVSSEIKALHRAGVPRTTDDASWARFLTTGRYPNDGATFWRDVRELPAGSALEWTPGEDVSIDRWYDLRAEIRDEDDRADRDVLADVDALMREAVSLRFRSDVPVGFSLSGGLDSSLLLAYINETGHDTEGVRCYTFVTGDEVYDELPWVEGLLAGTRHPLTVCRLDASDVPQLAADVQAMQDEPYGGLPTVAYARLCESARAEGTVVLLDGQGLDEQWAGYDYYRGSLGIDAPTVQGSSTSPVRPDVLDPSFASLATERDEPWSPDEDALRALQLRDILETKIPRAVRFNDRVSMRASVELREPFLDHRLVELALRQPAHRKVDRRTGKVLPRQLAATLLPASIGFAPKRPLQTPQREWLRGSLADWADALIREMLEVTPGWFDRDATLSTWHAYRLGEGDNSYFIWQWLSIGMLLGRT